MSSLDELKKEAEKHCNEVMCTVCDNKTCTEKIKCREWRDRCAGYYCGAEPREKRIAELEEISTRLESYYQNQKVRIAELEEAKANLEYLLEGRDNEIDELKKENKILAQNLEDTEILNNTYEKRFNNLKKENAELKLKLEALDGQTPWKDIKDKSELIGKLNKANELLKSCVCIIDRLTPTTTLLDKNERSLLKQAEQFLKEVESDKDHD